MVGRRFSTCFLSLYHHIRRAMPRSVQRVVVRVSCERRCTIVTLALESLLASKGKCPSQVTSLWQSRATLQHASGEMHGHVKHERQGVCVGKVTMQQLASHGTFDRLTARGTSALLKSAGILNLNICSSPRYECMMMASGMNVWMIASMQLDEVEI